MPSDMFSYVKKVLNNAADTPKTPPRRRMDRPERQRQSKLNSEVLRERYGIKEPLEVVRYNQKEHGLDKLKATISTGFQQATETVNKLSNQPSSSTSTKQNWKSTTNKEDPNTLTPNETPSSSRRRPSFEMAAAAALAAFRGENSISPPDSGEGNNSSELLLNANCSSGGGVEMGGVSCSSGSGEEVPRKGFNEAEAASMASSSAEDNRCKVCFKTLQETEFFRVCTVCIKRVCEDCSATYKNNNEQNQVNNWTCSICIRRRANREKGKRPTNSFLKAQQNQQDRKRQENTNNPPPPRVSVATSLDEEATEAKISSGLTIPVNNARRHSTGNAVADAAINAVAAAAAAKGNPKISSSKLLTKDGTSKIIRRPSSAALTAGIATQQPKQPPQQQQIAPPQQVAPPQQKRPYGMSPSYGNPGVVVTNHDEDNSKRMFPSSRSMMAHARSESQLAPQVNMKRRSSVAIIAPAQQQSPKPVLGRTTSDKSLRIDSSVLLGNNNVRKSELSAPSSSVYRRHSGGTLDNVNVQKDRRRKSSLHRSQSSEESSEDFNIGYMPYYSGSIARLQDDENASFTVGSSTSSIPQDIARELDLLAIRGKEERRSSFESAVSDSAALGAGHDGSRSKGPDMQDDGPNRRYRSLERSDQRQRSSSITKGGMDHVRIVVNDYGDNKSRNDVSLHNTTTITLYQTQHDPYGFGLRVVGAPYLNTRKNESICARVLWLCPGGPAQRAGIQVGDKILKWGGTALNSIAIERIPQIIEQSQDPKVTLILATGFSNGSDDVNTSKEGNGSRRRLPVLPSTNRRSSSASQLIGPQQTTPRPSIDYGQVELAVWYENMKVSVTLWSAENLHGIESSTGYSLPKPYAIVRLCMMGRNRMFTTEVDSGNQHPIWSAKHVFTNIEENDFLTSELEVTIWNYSNSQKHECLGKVVLENASLIKMNNKLHWYPLQNPNGYGRYDIHSSSQNSSSQQQISIHTDDYSACRQDPSPMELAYQGRTSSSSAHVQYEPPAPSYSLQELSQHPTSSQPPQILTSNSSYVLAAARSKVYSSNSSGCLFRTSFTSSNNYSPTAATAFIGGVGGEGLFKNSSSFASSFHHLNAHHQYQRAQSRSCPQSRRTSAEYAQGSMNTHNFIEGEETDYSISKLYSSFGSLRRRGSSNSSSKESLKSSQRRNNSACLLPVSSNGGRLHVRRKSDCGNRTIPVEALGLDEKVRRNNSLDRGGEHDPYSNYGYDNSSRRNSRLY